MENRIYTVNEIQDIVLPILRPYNVKKVILYGSYAKACPSDQSDVDLYIDSGGVLNGLNFFTVYYEVEASLNKKLDMVEALDVMEDSRIYREIMQNGVVLYEQE